MEVFKTILFGLAGLSLIFWIFVIAAWHTYSLPNMFREDYLLRPIGERGSEINLANASETGLMDRGKYSSKSFVIADFNSVDKSYSVNRLYTSILLSLGIMSFIILSYGLQSGFKLYGLS